MKRPKAINPLDLNSSFVFTFLGGFENHFPFSRKKRHLTFRKDCILWSGIQKGLSRLPPIGYTFQLWRTLVQNRYFKLQCPGGRKKIFSFANGNTVDENRIWHSFFQKEKLKIAKKGRFFSFVIAGWIDLILGVEEEKKRRFQKFNFG